MGRGGTAGAKTPANLASKASKASKAAKWEIGGGIGTLPLWGLAGMAGLPRHLLMINAWWCILLLKRFESSIESVAHHCHHEAFAGDTQGLLASLKLACAGQTVGCTEMLSAMVPSTVSTTWSTEASCSKFNPVRISFQCIMQLEGLYDLRSSQDSYHNADDVLKNCNLP